MLMGDIFVERPADFTSRPAARSHRQNDRVLDQLIFNTYATSILLVLQLRHVRPLSSLWEYAVCLFNRATPRSAFAAGRAQLVRFGLAGSTWKALSAGVRRLRFLLHPQWNGNERSASPPIRTVTRNAGSVEVHYL